MCDCRLGSGDGAIPVVVPAEIGRGWLFGNLLPEVTVKDDERGGTKICGWLCDLLEI